MQVDLLNFKCPNCGHQMIYKNDICECEYCGTEFYIFAKNKVDILRHKFSIGEKEIDSLGGDIKNTVIQYNKERIAQEIGLHLLHNDYLTETIQKNPLENTSDYIYTLFVVKERKEK